MERGVARWIFGIGLLSLVGCQTPVITPGDGSQTKSPGPNPSPGAEAVTYYRDVLPIAQTKCSACHTEGGASFPVDTYEAARPMSGLMANATFSGRMPPWPPDPACSAFEGQEHRTLTSAETEVFQLWDQLGAPAGNPADAPPPPTPLPNPLGTPDTRLDAGGDFDFGNSQADLYWCFRLDPGLTNPADIVGMTITPDNTAVVHHVIVFREAGGTANPMGLPGFECGGVPSGTEFLSGWVPGAEPFALPPDHGMELSPDDALVMQVHYNAQPGAPPTDRSTLDIWYADAPVSKKVRVVWTGSIDINVPAGGTQTVEGSCTIPNGSQATVINVSPHMHEIATSMRSVVDRADGSQECMVDIPNWEFEWQGGYSYKEPLIVQGGDTLRTMCSYRNDGNTAVGFGEGTGDEMCFQFNFVVDDGQVPDMCFAPCTFFPCDQLF